MLLNNTKLRQCWAFVPTGVTWTRHDITLHAHGLSCSFRRCLERTWIYFKGRLPHSPTYDCHLICLHNETGMISVSLYFPFDVISLVCVCVCVCVCLCVTRSTQTLPRACCCFRLYCIRGSKVFPYRNASARACMHNRASTGGWASPAHQGQYRWASPAHQ
jgi:hypothetical protein